MVSDRGDLYLPHCLAALGQLGIHVHHVVDDSAHELGMAGAVNAAWKFATDAGWDYLFHVEEDFIIRDAPLVAMVNVLSDHPHLAQMVLKRQPWWGLEVELNDQLAAIKASAEHRDVVEGSYAWTEHRNLFSLNPCVIPRRIFEKGWDEGNEAGQSARLKARPLWFGVWGTVDDPPRCEHVGHLRAQGWRL